MEFNPFKKSYNKLHKIYADIESLIWKVNNCQGNPEKASITKIRKQITYKYSIWTTWTFDHIQNKHSLYRGENYRRRFCEYLL